MSSVPSVLLLCGDLMVVSRVAGAATLAEIELRTVGTTSDLLREGAGRVLIVLDLEARGCQPSQLVPQLRTLSPPPCRIVAFGPHVHGDLLSAAREAGCDEVLSRGQFHARLPDILGGAARP